MCKIFLNMKALYVVVMDGSIWIWVTHFLNSKIPYKNGKSLYIHGMVIKNSWESLTFEI